MKGFVVQVIASFVSIVIWELLVWISTFSFRYLDMDHIGIENLWFIVFFISVNLLFWSLSSKYNKFSTHQDKKYKKELLNELTNLKSEIENGFASVDEVVRWSHKVTPLIEFDSRCLEDFKRNVFAIKYAGDKIEIFIQIQKFMALILNEAVEKMERLHNKRFYPSHPKSSSNDHI